VRGAEKPTFSAREQTAPATEVSAVAARTAPKITLRFLSSDGSKWTKRLTTLAGASAAAIKAIGETPTFGSDYAVSDDGVCTVRVSGASLAQLFPATERAAEKATARLAESEPEDRGAENPDPFKQTAPVGTFPPATEVLTGEARSAALEAIVAGTLARKVKGVRANTRAAKVLAFLVSHCGFRRKRHVVTR
jgi:hypothetical protein